MLAIKTILHPTDFGESSQYALELACGLAADYGAHLVIIHVIAAPVVFTDGATLALPERGVEGVRARLNHLEIPERDIDVIRRVEEGNPAAEILGMAELCHADLIVMGTHGRRGLRRWLMGSVADAVARKATCPVLTVTSRAAAQTPAAYFLEE
jgi:nucleotide-binding universal stress UspA family protein